MQVEVGGKKKGGECGIMRGMELIMALLSFGVAACAAAWVALCLREHGLRPLRGLAALKRRPAWEAALVAAIAVGMIHHGATKGTNGCMGVSESGAHGIRALPGESGGRGATALPAGGESDVRSAGRAGSPCPPLSHGYGASGVTAATNADWLAFGGYEDWFHLGGGGWCFRFGSKNAVSCEAAFGSFGLVPPPFAPQMKS